jgi:hypothetical protein
MNSPSAIPVETLAPTLSAKNAERVGHPYPRGTQKGWASHPDANDD